MMDDSGEILSTESHAPAARADETETDVVSELTSKKNDPDKTLHLSSQPSVSPSGTEDEKTNQQCIKDTADLDFVHDSITDDSRNETLVEDDTEMCEVPDTALNTDDLLINSNPTDSITETIKGSKSDQKTEKISQFPLGRVRDIMKADPDIKVVSAECVFLVAKATEMFLQRLGTEIHAITLRNKKKTLQKKDLDAVISENVAFEFLDGALN